MRKFIFLIFTISLFLSYNLHAIEKGKWTFFLENNYCYIGSIPIKEEGDYTQRGDTYTIVYRINKSPEKIVQITAGYNYDENKPVIVKIDQKSFKFFSSFTDGGLFHNFSKFTFSILNEKFGK